MARRIELATILVAATMACGGGGVARSAETSGLYSAELDLLRKRTVREEGQASLVKAHERFIAKYATDPHVAEAMLDLAAIYGWTISDLGVRRESELKLKWYYKAAESAKPGSKTWKHAQWMIVGRLRSDPRKARAILKSVSDYADGDSLTLAKVEYYLVIVCDWERNFNEAEEHCRRLLQWYKDPARVPSDGWQKAELDGYLRNVASSMIAMWERAPWTKAERIWRIEEFANEFWWVGGLRSSAERAVKDLRAEAE